MTAFAPPPGQPPGPIQRNKSLDQLLQLPGLEARQRDAGGGFEHPLAIALRAEEPQSAIKASVGFHAFEAFGGVVEGGGHGREGQRGVGRDGWG